MSRYVLLVILLINSFTQGGLFGIGPGDPHSLSIAVSEQDTLKENQILYNGRYWRNLYYKVKQDQFLFSKEMLPGSLTIDGTSFSNISIRYDIFNDEIMIPTNNGAVLQVNKEMVDSFNIVFQNTTYHFTKIETDTVKKLTGYFNVLYKGKTALYVKYKKEIEFLAVERKYDMFFQTHKIYLQKDSILSPVTGKGELFNLLDDKKEQIKSFSKKNRLKFSKKNPESFIPVVKFYDSLNP
jgi:hypothetical protein